MAAEEYMPLWGNEIGKNNAIMKKIIYSFPDESAEILSFDNLE